MTCRQQINQSQVEARKSEKLVKIADAQSTKEDTSEEGGNFVELKFDDKPPKRRHRF